MADVAEPGAYPDAATAISQGRRHLLVQDYTAAVTAFAEGLEMMSQKLGECDDELGEPYLLYGRALLGLAREEAGVLGGGVPGSDDAEDDEENDDGDDVDDEKMSEGDDKTSENDENPEKTENEDATSKKSSTAESTTEKIEKIDDKPKTESHKDEKPKTEEKTNETDEKKIETEKLKDEETKKDEKSVDSVAGSSKLQENGTSSKMENNCNGNLEKTDEDGEDVNKDDDEEDPGRGIDLQVAWEVLELAKIVFTKRGEAGLKKLAETHRLLGEVAMESDNPQGAITDLEGALKLLEKVEPCEPRAIAELHYQLGLAHSLLNDFDASIGQFNEATTLLESRIKQLEEIKDPGKSDDPFYTVEGEIKELMELLPAIQEKITDMKDFKEEACRLVIEGIKNKVAGGGCSNGAGTSNDGASSSSSSQQKQDKDEQQQGTVASPKNSKPASDISHLVRKKRKADGSVSPTQSPCKKPTP